MRKVCELGRSMVEMLGVLAIIGVLSVGGIAGYSKAMFKYKLTRQSEQLHQIFNTAIKYVHSFNFKPDNVQILATQLVPYFIKLDEIPKEMIKNNSSTIIYDVFNTSIYIMKEEYPNQSTMSVTILPDLVNKSKQNLDICRNIILTVQKYSDSVHYIQITSQLSFKGDKYCNGNNCLRNITNEQIYQFCTSQLDSGISSITIGWKDKISN